MTRILKLVSGDCMGEAPEYFRDNWLIGAKTASQLTPVDESVEKYYEECISNITSIDDLIKIFLEMEKHEINIVSMDGVRVFRVSEQRKIIESIRDKTCTVFDPRWFNRTLGVRPAVVKYFLEYAEKKLN